MVSVPLAETPLTVTSADLRMALDHLLFLRGVLDPEPVALGVHRVGRAADLERGFRARLQRVADHDRDFVDDLLRRTRRDESIGGIARTIRRIGFRRRRLCQCEAHLLAVRRRGVGAPGAELPDQGRLGAARRGGGGRFRFGRRLCRWRWPRAWAHPWPHPWRPSAQRFARARRKSPRTKPQRQPEMSVFAARTTGSLIIVTGRWPEGASRRRAWIAGKCFFGKAVTALPTAARRAASRTLYAIWRISNAAPPSASGAAFALLLPLRIGPLQQILRAGTAQMRAAVLHHHLAVDVAGLIGNQEAGEIGELAMLAGAAERIAMRPAFIAALGPELARSARGRKRAGRDRDQCAHPSVPIPPRGSWSSPAPRTSPSPRAP